MPTHVEAVEPRRLFSVTITGYVYQDNNNDGSFTAATDFKAADRTVYGDLDGDYVFDANEPSAVTGSDGNYSLTTVAGFQIVRQITPPGSTIAPRATSEYAISPADGGVYSGYNFGSVLVPGTITGSIYNDINGNAINDGGAENTQPYGAAYVMAYVDADNNGAYTAGELYGNPNGKGNFQISRVPIGTYTVRLSVAGAANFNLRQTAPLADGGFSATVLSGASSAVGSFGLRREFYVSGYAFNDLNANAVYNANEPVYSGRQVYDDANGNGEFDAGETNTVTSATGLFQLKLYAGPHTIREVLPAGSTETSVTLNGTIQSGGGAAFALVDSISGGATSIDFASYANTAVGTITGSIFNDANGNGVKDSGEGTFTSYGVSVYLDTIADGKYTTGERSVYVGGIGTFTFANLTPGRYVVRMNGVENQYVRQTSPLFNDGVTVDVVGGQTAAPVSFGGQQLYVVYAQTFLDPNGNGVPDSTETVSYSGRTVYEDINNNGRLDGNEPANITGVYGATSLVLPAGDHTLRQVVPNGFSATAQSLRYPVVGSTFQSDSVVHLPADTTGAGAAYTNFGSIPGSTGAAATGTVFNDINKNSKQDATETGVPNIVVYIDLDNDKVLDSNEVSTVTDNAGGFTFNNLPDTGTITRLRAILPAGSTQVTPVYGKGWGLKFGAGVSNPGLNFGFYTPPVAPPSTASLGGFVFDDLNKDGRYDSATEPLTSGKTVFLDLDGDGVLEAGEKSVVSGANGAWIFTGLAGGTYHVRRVFPSGYAQSNALVDVTLADNENYYGALIGSKSVTVTPPATGTASLSGSVFNDNNKNGKYDTGDGYGKGVVVFLDKDNDGILDTGESSVTTDSSGKFSFTKLAAGSYHVRRVMPTGYTYSTTKIDVTLTAGQAKLGQLIGTKKV